MILIADDDKAIRLSLDLMLRHNGYDTATASSPEEALAIVRSRQPSLIIMDMNYGGGTDGNDGIELLRKIRILAPDTPVILITAWGSIPLAVEGMKYGASDFITKPCDTRLLMRSIDTLLRLHAAPPADADAADTFDRSGIIGKSKALEEVLDTVRRVAPTDASVLITGENGTGKELIARAIHNNSARRHKPFVMVNLGGISQSLFESEMFGHAKGAFTGAVGERKGRFELADKGTIFLDEIGDLEPGSQVKLLRVLQQHTFEPLGDSRPRSVDIRVVSATNADLPALMRDRIFREDLFYRINTVAIHVPPLRERREDIPLLVRHFADSMRLNRPVRFAPDAMEFLTRLPYPGNIRQLRNIVERCAIIASGDLIRRSDIEKADAGGVPADTAGSPGIAGLTLDQLEEKAIRTAMEKHPGNLSAIAVELGISRQALYRRMEKYHLK